MSKIWRILICLVMITPLSLVALPVSAATPILYEKIQTGGDGDSAKIYGGEYEAEIFTTGAAAHSITSIQVDIARVGSPNYVDVDIEGVTVVGGVTVPDGIILTSGQLNGNAFSTSNTFQSFIVTEYELAPATQYALVVKLDSYGDSSTDYITWRKDTGGDGDLVGNAGVSYGLSYSDTTSAWTSNTPTDYLFRIYGRISMSIVDAAVFQGYATTGDWLITAECINVYPQKYTTEDASRDFNIQLRNGSTIIGATTLKDWGDKPVAIYLSKAAVQSLKWGGAYTVRMVAMWDDTIYVDYALVASDWKGDIKVTLHDWCIATANHMYAYDGSPAATPYVTKIAGVGNVLTTYGGTDFVTAIDGLDQVLPSLFETSKSKPDLGLGGTVNNAYQNAVGLQWQTQVGTVVAADATTMGTLLGVSGKQFLAFFFWAFFIVVLLFTFFNAQGAETPFVLVLAVPVILFANYLRVIDIQVTVVCCAVCGLLWVRKFFWATT